MRFKQESLHTNVMMFLTLRTVEEVGVSKISTDWLEFWRLAQNYKLCHFIFLWVQNLPLLYVFTNIIHFENILNTQVTIKTRKELGIK